jgi:hypothetical protein
MAREQQHNLVRRVDVKKLASIFDNGFSQNGAVYFDEKHLPKLDRTY